MLVESIGRLAWNKAIAKIYLRDTRTIYAQTLANISKNKSFENTLREPIVHGNCLGYVRARSWFLSFICILCSIY